MVYLSLLIALMATLGGSLSYLANEAPPGTVLFTYRSMVNEPVEEFLAKNDEDKARLNLLLIDEHLTAAKSLALQNKLTVAGQAAITEEVASRIQAITEVLERLEVQKKHAQGAQIAKTLYQTLENQTESLALASTQGSLSVQLALAPIVVRLRTAQTTVSLLATAAAARANGIETNITPPASVSTIQR